ncbi:MAG TPA: hypothetical protein VIC27_13915 [Ktedonobacterales bacterium]
MDLRFEAGDEREPRGHAILFARTARTERILATYCVILPIQFSIGKYLPPMLAGQIPVEAMTGEASMSAMPIPPMLEETPSVEALRQLAEMRGDDLCDMGMLLIDEETQRMAYAAEACATYGRAYARYQLRWPDVDERADTRPLSAGSSGSGGSGRRTSNADAIQPADGPLDDLDVDAVIASLQPERERLGEISRLIGQARYAMETGDQRQLSETRAQLTRLAASLPDKYRADQLAQAALATDPSGPQLAALYLQRAYKLLDEDYISIPPIEQQIRDLRAQHEQS